MILTHRSSAWLLAGLQTLFAILLTQYLLQLPVVGSFHLFAEPTWLTVLILISFGLAFLLALCALWKFEITAIVLLFAVHIICPLLFFTDLTRNPYFTQIVLLNIWIAFYWLVWLWESYKNQRLLFPKTVLELPLVAFLAVITLSWFISFLSHDKSFYPSMFWEGLKRWLYTVVNCLAVFYIAITLEEKWRKRFIWTTFLVGGIAAIYGLMQFYGIEKVWKSALFAFGNRPVSTFGNPNFLSSYLLLLVPLIIATILTCRAVLLKVISVVLLFILLAGIVATMTRSTWVGTVAALSLMVLLNPLRSFITKNKTLLFVFGVLFISYLIIWPKSKVGVGYDNPFQRIIETLDIWRKKSYQPWHQRILIWSSCWQMVQDHWLLGKGWGLLELFYPYYQGKTLYNEIFRSFRTHANNAHNEMLEVWSQTGFLGMGIYVWMWVAIFYFGWRCVKTFSNSDPEKALWVWAFTCGALGMLVDNFFGNVSLHFAVPGFLFWWQLGLLFSIPRVSNQMKKITPAEFHKFPIQNNLQKFVLSVATIFLISTSIFNFRREFQEIYYFLGFKISKTSQALEQARIALEKAWLWYPREVNTNYELANTYARLSYQAQQEGLHSQAEQWRKKAIWGYRESLFSNCGYDEIYFNLGTVLSQSGWQEENFPSLSIETPRGQTQTENSEEIGGAIYNFSRAIAINPLSQDAYHFLGNILMQNRQRYGDWAIELYSQASKFFPENKDIWVNLTFLYREKKNYPQAYSSLKRALALDPFYTLARTNLRATLQEMNKASDPLLELDQILNQMIPLIQARNFSALKKLGERAVTILPESFQLHFILANTLFELREWQRAEKEYAEALKLDPQNLSVLNNLALTYQAQNKKMEAKKIYQKILSLKPEEPNAKTQLKMLE